METNLNAFMKPELKEEQTITLPGIDAFKDDKGKPIPFILRRLSRERIAEIRDNCTTRTIVKDHRTNRPMVSGNRIVYDEQYDSDKAGREIMVECFVQPDLTSEKLRSFYGVQLNSELPDKLFRGKDFDYANKCVLIACGLADEETEDEVIKQVKN